jgi:hypothetical protein
VSLVVSLVVSLAEGSVAVAVGACVTAADGASVVSLLSLLPQAVMPRAATTARASVRLMGCS